MTMASRDIANMHLFLEMKKKFPDLPEDTLRNYVFLYAEDQDKCIKLLQQESQNHFHPSQPFSDFRLPDSKTSPRKNESVRTFNDNQNNISSISNVISAYNRNPQMHNELFSKYIRSNPDTTSSSRSISNAGIVHQPHVSTVKVPLNTEPHSAPILNSHEKPFADMYKQNPTSSPSTLHQLVIDQDRYNRMMFSTTKEHTIQPHVPSTTDDSTSFLSSSSETKQHKRHAVELNITPSFPFQSQQINLFNNAVCATASHSSRPGRHTTSLNFQLQPQSSSQYPIEISTIPTNTDAPCNYRDFGSHVQISVGTQGATFTALRLQRPHLAQNLQTVYSTKLSSEQRRHQFPESSSQAQDSKMYMFPNRMEQNSESILKGMFMVSPEAQDKLKLYHQKFSSENSPVDLKYPLNKMESDVSIAQGYQLSPDYVKAVKQHQKYLLKLIQEELEKEKTICSQLKSEINRMEQETNETKQTNSFSYDEELKKLREENRKLRIECNCLLMEVDTSSSAQIPLGMTDEDFYSNIFTGPNGAISSPSKKSVPNVNANKCSQSRKDDDDDDDERNRWRCKKCTFANYPALENCEMCELPRNTGYIECNSNYSSSAYLTLAPSSNNQSRRAVGSVQISVTRRVPSSSKSVKLQLTRRMPR